MGLPATRKPATEEDRGEDNKDPDWLIEQSIVRQVGRGGYTVQRRFKVAAIVAKLKLRSTSCNDAHNKNIARQVAEVTCYTVQFLSNLSRSGVGGQLLRKLHNVTAFRKLAG